jgi:hypothetical protein
MALYRMFNQAISGMGVPKHLSSDNDPLFTYHQWQANLRVLDVDEIKTVSHIPWSHPLVERLMGSLRRELPDQVFFWNAVDLERKSSRISSSTTMNAPSIHHSVAIRRRRLAARPP